MSYGFADYVLGPLLGAGGMGSVYAAEHAQHGAVAIKLLHEALAADENLVARIADEAYIGRKVAHPNVVRVIEHGTTQNGTPYLVMQRAAGTPLNQLVVRDGPLALRRVRAIASQILAGLAAIHRAGLVHGDMKSGNVLVDENDQVSIIDFGLTRPKNTRPDWLAEEVLSGTPAYMAPELLRGEPMTTAAELYAVGVIVYEMVTGATPFDGGSTTEVFENRLTNEVVPPSLRCRQREVPHALDTLIMSALDKHPPARFQEADLFAMAIERAIPETYRESRTSGIYLCRTATRDQETSQSLPQPRRLAGGTMLSGTIQTKRDELAAALAFGDPKLIAAAHLALVHALLDEQFLQHAARALEQLLAWQVRYQPTAPDRWSLFAMLSGIYDSLGRIDRARLAANMALEVAHEAGDEAGIARATALVEQYETRLQMQA